MDALPEILKDDEYPYASALITYGEMKSVVERYECEVREYNTKLKQKERAAENPPELTSICERLRQLQQQGKQQSHKKKPFDRDSS